MCAWQSRDLVVPIGWRDGSGWCVAWCVDGLHVQTGKAVELQGTKRVASSAADSRDSSDYVVRRVWLGNEHFNVLSYTADSGV